MVYRSKIDLWLALIVLIGGIVLVAAAVELVIDKGLDRSETWVMIGIAIFYAAIVLGLAYPVSYDIQGSQILIRSGLVIKQTIPISSIEKVRPSRNPLSAPAWSLDRLRVDYRKKDKSTFALLSPDDKSAFMRELVQMDTGLELRENEVILRTSV